jgi:hypothetical protein
MRQRLTVARANTWAWVKVPQGLTAGVFSAAVAAVAGSLLFHKPGRELLVALAGVAVGYLVYVLGVFGWYIARAEYTLRPKRLEFLEGHAEAIAGYDASVSQKQLGVGLFLKGPNEFPDFRCAVRDKYGKTRTLYVPQFIPAGYDGRRGRPLTHHTYQCDWPGAPLEGGKFEYAWTIASGAEHSRVAWGWFSAAVRPFSEGEGPGL